MNQTILMGRLTGEPNLKHSSKNADMVITTYAIAVNRIGTKEKTADYFNCVAFGKAGEFASKYFHKGERVLVKGHLQNNNYEKDNLKIKQDVLVIETQEFADAPKTQNGTETTEEVVDGMTNIPQDLEPEDIPFA